MSHCIRVILAKKALIQELTHAWQEAQPLSLEQGFSLIPLTDKLHDEIVAKYPQASESEFDEFILLSPAIQYALKTQSQSGPIAYIETDYFGGEGTQSAILYEKGEIKEGPLESTRIGPINQVLNSLGVDRSFGKDAFDTVGLGNFRNNDDILDSYKSNSGENNL